MNSIIEGLAVGNTYVYTGANPDDDYPLHDWEDGDIIRCVSIETMCHRPVGIFFNERDETASGLVYEWGDDTMYKERE